MITATATTETIYVTKQQMEDMLKNVKVCTGGLQLANGNAIYLVKFHDGTVKYVQVTNN